MSKDLLSEATRALRETDDASELEVHATRARVMSGLHQTRVHRRTRLAFLLPIAATFLAASAWGAANGKAQLVFEGIERLLGAAENSHASPKLTARARRIRSAPRWLRPRAPRPKWSLQLSTTTRQEWLRVCRPPQARVAFYRARHHRAAPQVIPASRCTALRTQPTSWIATQLARWPLGTLTWPRLPTAPLPPRLATIAPSASFVWVAPAKPKAPSCHSPTEATAPTVRPKLARCSSSSDGPEVAPLRARVLSRAAQGAPRERPVDTKARQLNPTRPGREPRAGRLSSSLGEVSRGALLTFGRKLFLADQLLGR
jgi:hypothetical protein